MFLKGESGAKKEILTSFLGSHLCEDYGVKSTSQLEEKLPPEVEKGNVEYKLKLVDPSEERIQHLITQLKWR